MIGEVFVGTSWREKGTKYWPEVYLLTEEGAYRLHQDSILEVSRSIGLPIDEHKGFTAKKITEVRSSEPGLVIVLEDGAKITFDTVYDPSSGPWPKLNFFTEEESREWEEDFLAKEVLLPRP